MKRARQLVATVLAAATLATLGACSEDPNSIAAQAKSGSQKGFVSGDGRVETIPANRRGEPVELTGKLLDGAPFSSASVRGKPLVINVWASWCGPCAAEAPALKEVSEDPTFTETVAFVGINLREPAANGLAQVAAWGHTYPSLSDRAGASLLALQGKAAALPSTLVLDPQGRIAARVLGPVTASTLRGMLADVLAEAATS